MQSTETISWKFWNKTKKFYDAGVGCFTITDSWWILDEILVNTWWVLSEDGSAPYNNQFNCWIMNTAWKIACSWGEISLV